MARELIALAIALVAGCHCDSSAKAEAVPAGAPLADKPFYRVDRGPQVPCARGATCEAALVLTALGNYHVNKDYPFKFVGDPGDPATAIPVDGQGTFAGADAKHGTMTIKFRPASPGTAKLVGTFKLSVCSDDNCEIEAPRLELVVPVS